MSPSPRETDPYAAFRRSPLALPVAAGRAVVDHATSLYRRRDDLAGAVRADLAGAGRLLAAAGGGPGERLSPSGVVADLGPGRLLHLHGAAGAGEPVLVVVPQGTDPAVLLDGPRSVAGALAAEGDEVFAVDWAGRAGADGGIDDVLGALDRALDHLGGPVHLVGCSQGGWLAAILASLRPASVASLTLVGAPVTFHSGTVPGAVVGALSAARRVPPLDALVRISVPFWAGWQHLALSGDVWWVVDPVGEMVRLVRALGRVADDDEIASAVAEVGMFTGTRPMSLRTYEWFLENLLLDDALARGTAEVGGALADLSRVTGPVRLVAGTRDRLVPPAQVFAATRLFTGAEEVEEITVDAGHLELFTAAAGEWAGAVAGAGAALSRGRTPAPRTSRRPRR